MVNNCIVIFMEYIFIKNGRNMNVIVNYDHIFPWIACSSSGWVLDWVLLVTFKSNMSYTLIFKKSFSVVYAVSEETNMQKI